MAHALPNFWLGNGEGPSGTQPFRMARKNPVLEPVLDEDEPMSNDESEAITTSAQQARVIRPLIVLEGIPVDPEVLEGIPVNTSPEGCHSSDGEELEVEQILRRPSPVRSAVERNNASHSGSFVFLRNIARPNTSPPSKGKAVHFTEDVTDIMGNLLINNTERPVEQMRSTPDWSRLINPAFVGRRGFLFSVDNASDQVANVDSNMSNYVLMANPGPFEIRESSHGMGMFATKDIFECAVVVEEEALVRLLCFDVFTRHQKDDLLYQEVVDTLMHQYGRMQLPEDHFFVQSLQPFEGEEPFILRVMRKYGLEAHHPDIFHCTALYRNICRVNHSCDGANAHLYNQHGSQNDWEVGRLVARRDIVRGEEILLDYTYLGGKRFDKMEVFQKYRFKCPWTACKSCSGYEYPLLQDRNEILH